MIRPSGYLVIDVESIGLHGDAFAVAWVQADAEMNEAGSGCLHVPLGLAEGDASSREWVEANVTLPQDSVECASPRMMRDMFWAIWTLTRAQGHAILAECLWPVEAGFLAKCIADDPIGRNWEGPYPFHDIASVRLAAGLDPLATCDRLPDETPAHNPLADARQSLRLFREAMTSR